MSLDELEAEEQTLHQDDDGMMGGMMSGSQPPAMRYEVNEQIGNDMRFNE